MTENELHWLAGLIEGEGCFSMKKRNSHRKDGAKKMVGSLQINMTDRDVLERAGSLLGARVTGPYKNGTKGEKDFYSVRLEGDKAMQAMTLLKALMGERRRARIEEISLRHGTFLHSAPVPLLL